VALIALLWSFIQFTRLESAILAISQDPEAAQYMGIPSDRIFSIVMAISAALAAAAGVLAVSVIYAMWPVSWDLMSGLTGRENFGHSLSASTTSPPRSWSSSPPCCWRWRVRAGG